MEIIGLELAGFALFINKSEQHVYALLNGRRKVNNDIAGYLSKKLGEHVDDLFNLELPVPKRIREAHSLDEFRKEYPNPEYYTQCKKESSFSHFLKHELLHSGFFREPRYVWEICRYCAELKRPVGSDMLSKHLKYLVSKNLLRSRKAPIKRRNGGYGKREVDVFFLVEEEGQAIPEEEFGKEDAL